MVVDNRCGRKAPFVLKLYDASTDAVAGGTRRGQQVIACDHTMHGFISHEIHADTNFNISVGITTKFMERSRPIP